LWLLLEIDTLQYHNYGENMLKTITSALLATVISVSASHAQEVFYPERSYGQWTVYGYVEEGQGSPDCTAETVWPDGSSLQVTYSTFHDELFIWFRNNDWNILDSLDREYTGVLAFTNSRGGITSQFSFDYILLSHNEIVLPNLYVGNFLNRFAESHEMVLDMPGSIQTAYAGLTGTRVAVNELDRCVGIALSLIVD
jgi:hypothetical protein